jgi:nucleoside-diphosphate-sugar epimerase
MKSLIRTESDLIEVMTTPSDEIRQAVSHIEGDILILGVGGKMGPTLAELLVRAGARRVIGVSRFSDTTQRDYLESRGLETIAADLLDDENLNHLPDVPNIFFLAGFKFGATGNEALTWAMNTWLPGRVMQRFPASRIIYVSSGNVYAFTAVASGGARESGELGPIGEYAGSRLGGERIAEHFSRTQNTPLLIVRLFYATELRYGIIHDIAWKIHREEPIDLSMGHVNQIWQGDANAYLARLFPLCASPARTLNMTGADTLSVRAIAERLGEAMGRKPVFIGQESQNALLGNATELFRHLGPPSVSVEQIVEWMARWVSLDGRSLGKPTKYESRSGKF